MTLLDRIHQLQVKAADADGDYKIKSRSGDFTALRQRLEAAAANAVRADTARKELEFAGIVQDDWKQNRIDALTAVKELITTVENLSVEAKFDAVKIQGSIVEDNFKSSEKFVADAWKSYLHSTPEGVDDGFLDALEQSGVDVEAIRSDIEGAEAVLLILRSRKIPEAGDNAKLQAALTTLNSRHARIGEVIDPEIADVVVRAQSGGVQYTEMKPDVVSALNKLGILDRFLVVLK